MTVTVLDWLLDSDPALRSQVWRDLEGDRAAAAADRARIATQGWGARLLERRDADGQWAGGACFPAGFRGDYSAGQPWTSTLPTLTLLRDFWIDPDAPAVREAIALIEANCRWEYDDRPFFAGEVEPCINGRTVALGAYFGVDVTGVADRLLAEQLADGGWNCDVERGSVRSSFATTICVLEGLLEYDAVTVSAAVAEARRRGEEYLLARGLFRRLSTGHVADPDWLGFSFPTWWHYDVLRGLDYFRATGRPPDARLAEAIALLRAKRQPDGRWRLENTHAGAVHFPLEDGDGRPSRWNTLRGLRVLSWWDRAASIDELRGTTP